MVLLTSVLVGLLAVSGSYLALDSVQQKVCCRASGRETIGAVAYFSNGCRVSSCCGLMAKCFSAHCDEVLLHRSRNLPRCRLQSHRTKQHFVTECGSCVLRNAAIIPLLHVRFNPQTCSSRLALCDDCRRTA